MKPHKHILLLILLASLTVTGVNAEDIVIDSQIYDNLTGANGGVIYTQTDEIIDAIVNSTFSNNTAIYNGGAITNQGLIKDIDAVFTNNKTIFSNPASKGFSFGGAICNLGTINNITGTFTGNSTPIEGVMTTSETSMGSAGGAIYNLGTISSIIGDSKSNSVTSASGAGYGGAIFNNGTVSS